MKARRVKVATQPKAKHRIKRIRIRNVLGIEELDVEPGRLTVIEGANATGKTSFLAAIKALVGGGHDATLIRVGADAGEVVLELADETELRRRITHSGSRLEVKHDGTVQRSPQTWLDAMTDGVALNPIAFLEAAPKEQARMLLEAMPVAVTGDEITEAAGGVLLSELGCCPPDGPVPGHALEVVDGIRKRLYDERTGINRLVRDHEGTVRDLERALPDDELSDPTDEIAALSAERHELERNRRDRYEDIREHHQRAVQKITAEADKQLGQLRAQIHALEQRRDAKIAELAERRVAAQADLQRDIDAQIYDVREKTSDLMAQAKRAEDAERTRQAVVAQRTKLEAARGESETLSEAIDRLDALKTSLLERLPMRGLTVRDGVLYRGEIPFRRLNRAEQIRAALRLATIRAGEVPIVCADGLEALDPETFEAFITEARDQDAHLFVTRVTSDPELVIRTDRGGVAHA